MKQLYSFVALLCLINISVFSQLKVAAINNNKISSASLAAIECFKSITTSFIKYSSSME